MKLVTEIDANIIEWSNTYGTPTTIYSKYISARSIHCTNSHLSSSEIYVFVVFSSCELSDNY